GAPGRAGGATRVNERKLNPANPNPLLGEPRRDAVHEGRIHRAARSMSEHDDASRIGWAVEEKFAGHVIRRGRLLSFPQIRPAIIAAARTEPFSNGSVSPFECLGEEVVSH